MRKVGLVGLGNMGLPIAGRIVQAGFSLVAYNRTKSKQDALRGKAEMVSSQRDVAEMADSIVIAVSDTTAVEDVMFSSQGMYERIAAGKTIINCSDILPSTSKRIMEKLKQEEHQLPRGPTGRRARPGQDGGAGGPGLRRQDPLRGEPRHPQDVRLEGLLHRTGPRRDVHQAGPQPPGGQLRPVDGRGLGPRREGGPGPLPVRADSQLDRVQDELQRDQGHEDGEGEPWSPPSTSATCSRTWT